MNKLWNFLKRFSAEPPFRLFSKMLISRMPCSIRTKARWEAVPRPNYLEGVLAAADEAKREGVSSIAAYEFGVAGGNGLLALAEMAEAVERETGIEIKVYGFDAGSGLPSFGMDFREHPDQWIPGDYPMDQSELRKRLKPNTTLIIGEISRTLPDHIRALREHIGFVSVDVDLYSSTKDILRMFEMRERRMLRRVFMYFDDVDFIFNHRFAGELLAIDEFNASVSGVKIDRWRGIQKHRPFSESPWLQKMYIAHDLEAITQASRARDVSVVAIDGATK